VPDFSQQNSPLQVFTPLPENTLLATRLVGSEKLGGIFEFKVSLVAQRGTAIDFASLMGHYAGVTLHLPGGVTRHFHGVILAFAQEDGDEVFDHYTMTLKPRLARLGLTKRSRIFQDRSALEIWKFLLDQIGVSKLIEMLKPLPKRVCITQYRETDLDFFLRLCSDTGNIHYWRHSADNHVLTITDDTTQTASDLGTIYYDQREGGTAERTSIRSWRVEQSHCPTQGSLSGNNFQLFNQKLDASTPGPMEVGAGGLTLHRLADEGPWEEDEISASRYFDAIDSNGIENADATPDMYTWQGRKSRIIAYSAAAGMVRATAVGDCSQLSPGHSFSLADHPNQDGEWLVVSVRHTVEMEGRYWAGETSAMRVEARAECAPLSLPQYHWPILPRPRVSGVQTGIVIGPEGEEVFVDRFGRVQVRFWWDRDDSTSSCWMRVAQSWAGNGWGAVFWPRVGHEVVVAFENGDPDRPMVVGSVYNASNMPPYSLPANKFIAGWKSLTQGGDPSKNFHQILMSDEKDAEVVHIHAESMFITHQESQQFTKRPSLDVNFQG
jgi:type VI secretion system secreted protein VgrG